MLSHRLRCDNGVNGSPSGGSPRTEGSRPFAQFGPSPCPVGWGRPLVKSFTVSGRLGATAGETGSAASRAVARLAQVGAGRRCRGRRLPRVIAGVVRTRPGL